MKIYKFDHNDEVTKNEYFRIHLKMARLLRKDLSPEERADIVL